VSVGLDHLTLAPGGRRTRGTVLFGTVITPALRGQAAGQLWDGVVLVVGADGFFELKRKRTRKAYFE
jgi:hypothetical protein